MSVDVDAVLSEILLAPEGRADPYPRYALLREHGSVFRSGLGPVVATRYAECQAVLRDPRFGQPSGEGPEWEAYGLTQAEWEERFPPEDKTAESMLGLNPPDHTRLRSLVAKAFTPSTVGRLRPRITTLAAALIEELEPTADVIAALALPLPIAVISEMLGVPESQWAALQPLVRDVVQTLEFNPTLEQLMVATAAEKQIAATFEELMRERRSAPTDDLLSNLVHVEEQGDRLTHAELIATVILLFAAGFETTTNLIGNGLLALLEHPEELGRLRADRSLVRTAVEEELRWDSPVQLTARVALADAEVGGLDVGAGSLVIALLGSANHDDTKFEDPDRFDISRTGAPPMSFGSGIHFCLGAALARVEGQVVLDHLLDRFPTIEPAWGDTRPPYRNSLVLHGLESLPVAFSR
jgi:hypothetical protein